MAAELSFAKKIIISKCPFLWVYKITDTATAADDALTLLYKFDNASDIVGKMLSAGSASSSTEYIEFSRADGGGIKFPKEVLNLDGVTEAQIASDTGGADASGLGEITASLNEAPIGTTIPSWTAFVKDLQLHKDDKLLLIYGTGYTYNRTGTDSTRKPDGYGYMLGKPSGDIEVNTIPLPLTFASQKASGWDVDVTEFNAALEGIDLKRGGAGYDIDKSLNVPVSLTAEDIAQLKAGKMVLKDVA